MIFIRSACKILSEKCRRKDNIKVNLREIRDVGVHCINWL